MSFPFSVQMKQGKIYILNTLAVFALLCLLPVMAWASSSVSAVSDSDSMREEVLAVHNQYRAEMDVPPLVWSETLADHAQQWANHLVRSGGQLRHSRVADEGENLWRGTTEYFSNAQKVECWGRKKTYFKGGIFSDVSTSGNWMDVGHYTQIIWRNTTEVGCAKATTGKHDIFVCRYFPPGNIYTKRHDDLY